MNATKLVVRASHLAALVFVALGLSACPSDDTATPPQTSADDGVDATGTLDMDSRADAAIDIGEPEVGRDMTSDLQTAPLEPPRGVPTAGGGSAESSQHKLNLRIGSPRGTSSNNNIRLKMKGTP